MKTNDLFSGITRVAQGLRKGSARSAREWLKYIATLLLIFTLGVGNVWGKEGDVLKTYDTNSSTFATGYGRKTGDNFVWWGQKNYYGANNATNHGNNKPTAADLPVVKAQNASATTTTTGLYYCYTSEAVANVGALEIYLSANSGSSTVNAYIVTSSTAASSGSATWTKVTLSASSANAQGKNVNSAGTYRFTFNATETGAKYYGVVLATSSYWRATGFTMKLIEGATGSTKTLVYNANGATGGSVPTDATAYNVGDKATVKGNTGGLYKIGHTFAGWTDNSAGTGTVYTSSDKFTIASSGNTLYAKWTNTYAGDEFTLVEDLSDLGDGSKIVIIGTDAGGTNFYALKTTQQTAYRDRVASGPSEFTMSNSNKTCTLGASTSVQVITLEDLATPVSNRYQFNVENGYLYASSSSANEVKTQTPNNANGHWQIGLDAGVFTITAQGTNTRKVLSHNNSASRFACYTGNQQPTYIYVRDEGTKYAITWANGGHGTAPTSPTNASKVTLPDISITGWTNTGWKADVSVTNASTSASIDAGTLITPGTRVELGAATTFTAQWSINSHTLTWSWDGGSTTSISYTLYPATSGSVNYNAEITKPANGTMSKTGYTFSSWSSNATTMPDEDLTITAQWTANKYDVTLKPTNQTGSLTDQVVQATYDAAMPTTVKTAGTAIVIPERTGYSFTGWFDNSSGGKQYYQYTGSPKTLSSANAWDKTSATNLYAQWSINSYTLTWATVRGKIITAGTGAAVNATGNVSSSQEYNTALTAPECGSANGYTFTGWSPSVATNMPAANTTYTAQWSANVYTVTLDNQSATTAGAASVSATFGQAMPSIASNLPAKTGYRFDGYYTAKNGGGTKYYNADGSSATNMAMYSANPKLYANWVAQLTFSVNGAIDGTLTRDVTESLPSSATVPTSCGDCWAFAGWDASSSCSTTPGHAGGENAATHGITTPTTLYAVYGKTKYRIIKETSDISANEYYVLTFDSIGVTPAMTYNITDTYYTTSENIAVKSDETGAYIEGPISDIVWKFTGNTSTGRFYNEAGNKYMDISDYDAAPVASYTSDYMTITVYNSSKKQFNIRSNTETSYYLQLYNKGWGVDDDHDGYYSACIFKRSESTYTTVPLCSEYTVTWAVDNDGGSAKGTTAVNSCEAYPSTIPTAPADNTLSCATKFMGWSESTLIGTGQSAPADLFSDIDEAPEIKDDITFNAVFASVDTDSEAPADITTTFTSTAWADANSLWTSDKAAYGTDTKGVQVTKDYTGAGAHTKSSYNKVTSVVITYGSSNSATGSIAVSVGGTAMTLSSGSISGGQTDETLTYTPTTPATYLTGAVSFVVTVTNKSIYVKSIQINYTGYGYKDYMTSCCDKMVTIGTPTITGSGTVTFSIGGEAVAAGTDVETCTAGKTIVARVTPATGYNCTALSFSRDDAVTLDIDVDPSSTKPSAPSYQDYTMTFEKGADITLSTSATFSPIPVSSLTLHAIKKDNTSATIFEETSNNVALSLYPTEGKTASPADPLGHTVKIEFGAVLPANALNTGYTWSATVNGEDVGWSSNNLESNAVLEFNKNTGKVVAKAAGTAEIIITADDGSGVTAKVTITVANVALSSLNVAKSSTTLYVGESEQIAVTYDPVNTTTKGYTTGSYTYVTIGRSNDKITLTGKAVTPGEPERVTLTSSDAGAKTATIDVTVKPLPKVTFVDNLQGKTDFSNWGSDGVVSSTVTDGVVTHTKPTPSHTDISDPGASYNTCERQHLHLLGWIESTWADAHPSATHSQIIEAGSGNYYAAGASINVETHNGDTFYAVWAKVE